MEWDDETTKFNDLPDFCLDKILKYLDLVNLTMAANTTNRLASSAVRVFRLKFTNKEFAFNTKGSEHILWLDDRECETDVEKIGLLDCLTTLRHFGPMIRKLIIDVPSQAFLDQVTEVCGPNLTELNILLSRKGLQLAQPLPKLQKLKLITTHHYVTDSWKRINQMFPELRCLHIQCGETQFLYDQSMIETIPNLEKFSHIGINYSESEKIRQFKRIFDFLNRNHQITSLQLDGRLKILFNNMKQINWALFDIRYLNISTYGLVNVRMFAELKNLHSLRISGRCYNGMRGILFPKLEVFSIDFKGSGLDVVRWKLGVSVKSSPRLKELEFKIAKTLEITPCLSSILPSECLPRVSYMVRHSNSNKRIIRMK